jgi:hypothetical protein
MMAAVLMYFYTFRAADRLSHVFSTFPVWTILFAPHAQCFSILPKSIQDGRESPHPCPLPEGEGKKREILSQRERAPDCAFQRIF